jgi:hypothetical protein
VRCDRARVARESMIQSVRGFVRHARSDRPGGMPCAARPWGSFGARARAPLGGSVRCRSQGVAEAADW